MMRARALDAALSGFLSTADSLPREGSVDPAFDAGLDALSAAWAGDFTAAADAGARALQLAGDADARALAAVALGYAAAGLAASEGVPPPKEAGPDAVAAAVEAATTPALAVPLQVLLQDVALARARIDLASAVLRRTPTPRVLFGRPDHPFLTFARTAAARTALFGGDVYAAKAHADEAVAGAGNGLEGAFAAATAAVAAGYADERAVLRQHLRALRAWNGPRANAVASGVYLLASYAAIARNDVPLSAEFALRAAADADFSRLRIIDRAICFEVLVHAAADAGDLDAAAAWQLRARPLTADPIADSTVARLDSRVALLAGDAAVALAHAERAIGLAEAHGRVVEAAEGEIVAARARIALRERGEAERRLARRVRDAERTGFRAVRLSASRELRGVGRRLVRTGGWETLSERERAVAGLLAVGARNGEIARRLYLSEHTVSRHVGRILHALGAVSRVHVAVAVPASVRADAANTLGIPLTPLCGALTPRQRQVATLVGTGAGNAEIALRLGLSVSTVEKHVAAVMDRWGVGSRTAIAAISAAPEDSSEGCGDQDPGRVP